MMFASPLDLEPGMWFRTFDRGPALQFGGCDPIVSRFPGKRRVRVLVLAGGSDFVSDVHVRFQIIDWRQHSER